MVILSKQSAMVGVSVYAKQKQVYKVQSKTFATYGEKVQKSATHNAVSDSDSDLGSFGSISTQTK